MEIHEKYNFKDFTLSNYKQLVALAREKFTFSDYNNLEGKKSFLLWRHDVDCSVHRAKKLAEIECELGVKATYFLYPHSEYYNLLEAEISEKIRSIIALGHPIGLHFDVTYYPIEDERNLSYHLSKEKELLEYLFNIPIRVFSFHNPNAFALSCLNFMYSGMVNTYASFFKENVIYCSDSNGYWRFKRLEDVLNEPEIKRLQVLTHPEWWQDEVMAPQERIFRCIEGRNEKIKRQYTDGLASFNRLNITENGRA